MAEELHLCGDSEEPVVEACPWLQPELHDIVTPIIDSRWMDKSECPSIAQTSTKES